MQEYPVKRGYTKNLKENIMEKLKEHFGTEISCEGEHCRISFGALKILDVSPGTGGKTLVIDTESDISVSDEAILDTNRRFRRFLDDVTGYSTKERVKKAKTVEKK
ncbi:MAG: hypothetical protein APR55_06295 [Methanolinea sp. SDB]|nr:MAG: hypothetical protein APR55_06295 [Methanolinea sp. SDB]